MKRIAWTMLALLGTACAPVPTPLPDARSPAARLYASRCGVCHSTPHPRRARYAQWEHLLGLMEQQMAIRRLPALSEAERGEILAYLRAHGR